MDRERSVEAQEASDPGEWGIYRGAERGWLWRLSAN
jgi:hypothetical protein